MIATLLASYSVLQSATIVPGAVTGQLRTIDGVPAVNVRVVAFAVPRGRGNSRRQPQLLRAGGPD